MCRFSAHRRPWWLVFGFLLTVTSAYPVVAARLSLERPSDGEFIRDTAGLLPPGEVRQLQQRCQTLLDDRGIPLFVVTVDSMARFGGRDMTIETFTRSLFDQWGDDHPLIQGYDWKQGILLVVSTGDRAARIELGRTWAGQHDTAARRIMDEHLLPAFRAGRFAAGITTGVDALDQMSRGEPVPARPVPRYTYVLWAGFTGLAVFTAVSMFRRGRSGWAWTTWAFAFALLGALLHHFTKNVSVHYGNSDDQSSWGSWRSGGGSFGGTSGSGGSFGGGGGASGSW